jgi:RHS repeat-associated protein
VTKYYAFNGSRAVMRQANNEVFYLFGDHLGSSSLVVDWQGRKISEMRYAPWGETRWAWELDEGEGYTDRLYTSQVRQNRNYVGQLDDYGARFFNPTTARFITADAVVPNPGTPQGLSRYSFVYNNPFKFTDPSGHVPFLVVTAIGGALIGGGISLGLQLYNSGWDLKAVNPNKVLGAAVAGGVAGLTLGAGTALIATGSLVASGSAVVSAGGIGIGSGALLGGVSNVLGGLAGREVTGESTTAGAVVGDFVVGGVFGAAGSVLSKAGAALSKGLFRGSEKFFRAMSNSEYEGLLENGGLSSGGENFVSTVKSYSQGYLNKPGYDVLVQFNANKGTLNELAEVGVRNGAKIVNQLGFGHLPKVSKGWADISAYFKGEQGVLNIGLGKNSMQIFNNNLQSFKKVK